MFRQIQLKTSAPNSFSELSDLVISGDIVVKLQTYKLLKNIASYSFFRNIFELDCLIKNKLMILPKKYVRIAYIKNLFTRSITDDALTIFIF